MKWDLYCDLASLQQRILATPLRILLILFSWLYAAIVWMRNRLYTLGFLKAHRLPCTVISVGNIVVGGTGKTPAVIAIAKQLQKAGVRVAILLRGYKRRSSEKVTIVSDGEKLCCSAAESGDEAHMIASRLGGIPVLVSRRRYLAGTVALKRFHVEVLLLDDGFQHRQLARDVDILTLNATQPYGNPSRLLPAGTLREPRTALLRADVILLTHTDTPSINELAPKTPIHRDFVGDVCNPDIKPNLRPKFSARHVEELGNLKEALKRLAPNALILESVHQPTHLYRLDGTSDTRRLPDELLTGKRLLAVCGIANPDAFVTSLMRYCPETVELLAFPDHHIYTQADLRQIQRAQQDVAAELIVTTQKDEQKLLSFAFSLPIAVMAVALVVTEGNLADVLLPKVSGDPTI